MSRLAARVFVLFGDCFASAAGAGPLCTLIADPATGKVLKQEGQCEARLTPASTFRIALSLIGYGAGFLTDERHPALPYRDSYPATDPTWKTTVDQQLDHQLWYSQQLTIWLGKERLQRERRPHPGVAGLLAADLSARADYVP